VRQYAAQAAILVLVGTLIAAAGVAYDARPPLAHTGGFGEPTCAACHFGGPETPSGEVSLGGVPERYRPGVSYTLEVSLVDPAARVGGFQLAARITDGAKAGAQAGTLCATDRRVVVATDSATGVAYASHSAAAPADSLRWRLTWRAPRREVGSVIFHIAANAANDDDSALGDAILAASVVTRPKAAAVASDTSGC
jgi:hypothetical protein